MKKIVQVRIFKGEKQYVAECLNLPVVTQANTLGELTENLREAISLHLKGENLAELELAEAPSGRHPGLRRGDAAAVRQRPPGRHRRRTPGPVEVA